MPSHQSFSFRKCPICRMLSAQTLMILLVSVAVGHAHAAVIGIDSVSLDPSPAGDLRVDAVITSITVDGIVYDNLESITDVSFPGNPVRMWGLNADDPGSDEAAVLGLNYGTGVLNVGAGTNFQYGRTLGLDEILFVIRDGAAVGNITLVAINASNQVIGNRSLSLTSGQFNTLSKEVDLQRESGSNLNDRERAGVSFTLDDFGGTTGDLSTATGFRITTGGSTWDVTAVGVVVIPEPASLVLTAIGGLLLLPRRRR